MAREYSAFFDAMKPARSRSNYFEAEEGGWKVIFKDTDDIDVVWYIEVPDAGDRDSAIRLAEALNMRERKHDGSQN